LSRARHDLAKWISRSLGRRISGYRPGCSQVLRKLEAKGLICRDVDTADTRAKRLHVTDRGAALAAQAITAVESADARFFRPVPDPAALLAMLRPLTSRSEPLTRRP